MRQKVKVAPCRFCNKQFQRTEHLRRHERTHTKEKPFGCHCGQSFSRRDLLLRHERLSHTGPQASIPATQAAQISSEGSSAAARGMSAQPFAASVQLHQIDPSFRTHLDMNMDPGLQFTPQNDLSLMGVQTTQNSIPSTFQTGHPALFQNLNSVSDYVGDLQQSRAPSWDDLDVLWEDLGTSSNLMQPASFTPSYPMNLLFFSDYDIAAARNSGQTAPPIGEPDVQSSQNVRDDQRGMSRYGSRLPSLQAGAEQSSVQAAEGPANPEPDVSRLLTSSDGTKPSLPWRISRLQYGLIAANVLQYTSILPAGFKFPTKHALTRFVEGYFSGFHEHLPFFHPPTLSMESAAPELVLAIAAVGAQYRFQRTQAHYLYVAAKALAESQIRHRDGYRAPPSVFKTPSLLSDGNLQSHSPAHGRATGPERLNDSADQQITFSVEVTAEARLQTIQAMILLVALGTWNHQSLLKDAFALGSQLASLVQEDGLSEVDKQDRQPSWKQWIRLEEKRRTKLVAYCFLNLHSMAYDVPPKLMNSEIELDLPHPEKQWRASSSDEWKAQCRKEAYTAVSFRDGYTGLFSDNHKNGQHASPYSSFGNYVLIHSILQQIFFVRQSSPSFGMGTNAQFHPDTLSRLETALRRWQRHWDSTKDSSVDPSSPSGPLSFNSVAIFRIAYIRLYADLGPCRQLETRNPEIIAQTFHNVPNLPRTPHTRRAVLQSVHALSLPVRIGIEFVARTQTLTWSIVHSLCNLECAIFLSAWLNFMSIETAKGLSTDQNETRLLRLVRNVLGETDLSESIEEETDESRRYKRMAAAVVRLWAETFKGAHVFEIMGAIGAGLELHADMLEQELMSEI